MITDKAMVTDAIEASFRRHMDAAPYAKDLIKRIAFEIVPMVNASLTLERGEAEPVAVKPLRWKGPDASGEYHSLDGLWGYIIRAGNGNGFWLTEVGGYFRSVEGAQYAAQYDYETRILSTLSKRGEAEEAPAPVQHVVGENHLMPCPFCGSRVEIVETEKDDDDRSPRPHRVYEIECYSCDVRMEAMSADWWSSSATPPESENDRKAKARVVESWNNRTPSPSPRAAVSTHSPEGRL